MPERTESVPNRLREWRLRADLSQAALAAAAGYTPAQVSRWERGRHTLTLATAASLARVLGCHAEELLEATAAA